MPRPAAATGSETDNRGISVEWQNVLKMWEQVTLNEKAARKVRDEWVVLVQAWVNNKVSDVGGSQVEQGVPDCPPGVLAQPVEKDDPGKVDDLRISQRSEMVQKQWNSSFSADEQGTEASRRMQREFTKEVLKESLKDKLNKQKSIGAIDTSLSIQTVESADICTATHKRALLSRPRFLLKFAKLLRGLEDKGWYVTIHSMLIVLSVCTNIFQTMDACVGEISNVMIGFDFFINILFTFEVLARIAVTRRRAFRALCMSMYFWVDVLAVVPFYVKLSTRALGDETNMFVELLTISTPTMRLLKITRQSKVWRLLVTAMRNCVEPITVPTFFLALIVIFSSCILYWVEKYLSDDDPAFVSIPHAMWFSIVTITTVGYGDVTPNSIPGKVLCSILIVIGIFYFGMPLAIVGSSFTNVWDGRESILLMERFQARLAMDGTTEEDLRRIFESMDADGNGQLVLDEFITFFTDLDLGFTKRDCITLFRIVDSNGSGAVSFEEFVLTLFPKVEVQSYNSYD